MQKVAIILRKSAVPNLFRSIILDCFSAQNLGELTICSGFFQEKQTKGGGFFASAGFAASAPPTPCKKAVTTVGVYNHVWKAQYDAFASTLAAITCSCGCNSSLSVRKRKIPGYRWHAKVFIASTSGVPKLGIIGSSNMTSRAFGAASPFNHEADVVLWDDADATARGVMATTIEPAIGRERSHVIVANYAPKDPRNRGLTLSERLAQLREEIFEESVAL